LSYWLEDKAQRPYIIDIGSADGLKLKQFEGKYKIITIDIDLTINDTEPHPALSVQGIM